MQNNELERFLSPWRGGEKAVGYDGRAMSLALLLPLLVPFAAPPQDASPAPAAEVPATPGPHQANGIKIGEVTSTTAIVWTRLTAAPERAPDRWEVPGSPGEVRIVFQPADTPVPRRTTKWTAVDPERDFTHQFLLENLDSGRGYTLTVEARGGERTDITSRTPGAFRTAPDAGTPAEVRFVAITGQGFHRRDDPERGHRIYPAMLALDPDFFVHTGDIVYYDRADPVAKSIEVARAHWHRMYALPNQREFHAAVASYFQKDDHDILRDDCWPGLKHGELTFEDGLAIFREQVPMGNVTFRNVRWGKDLEIWLLEVRDYRSSNKMEDGPAKTILGPLQRAWLRNTLAASDATFRVIISPTPIVGPDRRGKADNHANEAFATEGELLRTSFAALGNAIVVCGDRHWQYVSRDSETGLFEFSTGPTTDQHAGGFREENRAPEHRFLRIAGGFLEVLVHRPDDQPRLTLRHRDVAGELVHEEVFTRREK